MFSSPDPKSPLAFRQLSDRQPDLRFPDERKHDAPGKKISFQILKHCYQFMYLLDQERLIIIINDYNYK